MTQSVGPITRHSVVAQVREHVRAAMLSGDLAPGTLYSVGALAEELGVSRTPVREALLQLAQLGLIEFHRNRGFTIVSVTVPELIAIFQLRIALETAAVRRFASHASDAEVARLDELLTDLTAAAEDQDRTRFMTTDRALHEALLDGARNTRVHDAVRAARDAVYSRGMSTSGSDRSWQDLLTEHRTIVEAVTRRDPDAAADAMRVHLVNTGTALAERSGSTIAADWHQGWC